MEGIDFDAIIESQEPLHRCLLGFARTMVLKCAVELRLADIIHSHDTPITLSQIASAIDSPNAPDISSLERVMRLLVCVKIFTAHQPSGGGETLYGPTKISTWICHDHELSQTPLVAFQTNSWMIKPWSCFSQCIKEGGTGFEKAESCQVYELASQNPEFNKLFNDAMACNAKMPNLAIVKGYKDGLKGIKTLADVGGGVGETIAAIVLENPHIEGINFDLPHVVSMAPQHQGVTHIGGSMFETIPKADAIMLKWILHNWSEEKCVTILKNCRQAMPAKTGKLIIIDKVLDPNNEMNILFDLAMLAITGGKVRTEPEWKKILKEGGFPRYEIIYLVPNMHIIEAYQV